VTVHVQIEAQAAPALTALPRAQQAVTDADAAALTSALDRVASALELMNQTLLRMPENCDPYIYYQRVRPFIHGWQQHPVVYSGVSE
jgi:indoleamine 2,3-dioxygenase